MSPARSQRGRLFLPSCSKSPSLPMVTPKGMWSLLILLLATTLVFEASCQCLLRNRMFYREHYDFPRSNFSVSYCDGIMKQRGLTTPTCTETSTFIHAPKEDIGAVCGEGGEVYQKGQRAYQRSIDVFSVTNCKLRSLPGQKPCLYGENDTLKHIVITCRKGRPVYLEETQN